MMMFCDQRARCLEGMLMGVKPQIAELVVKCLQYHPRRRMQLPQMRAKVKAMLGHKRRKTRSIHPPQERWWQSSTLPVQTVPDQVDESSIEKANEEWQ